MNEEQKHIVRQGESLTSIARRYGTSPKRLVELNALDQSGCFDASELREGQILRVPSLPTHGFIHPNCPPFHFL